MPPRDSKRGRDEVGKNANGIFCHRAHKLGTTRINCHIWCNLNAPMAARCSVLNCLFNIWSFLIARFRYNNLYWCQSQWLIANNSRMTPWVCSVGKWLGRFKVLKETLQWNGVLGLTTRRSPRKHYYRGTRAHAGLAVIFSFTRSSCDNFPKQIDCVSNSYRAWWREKER